MDKLLHSDLTKEIIKAFYEVYNTLGYGFLEKVYENALMIELRDMGYRVAAQEKIKVYYQDVLVGDYYADIIVEEKVILELKAAEKLVLAHEIQLQNYLKATEIEVGMLLNFGKEPKFKRKVYSNKVK